MFKYLWQAKFANDGVISQPEDDRYSKHDDNAEHNPSAFRDIQEYEEKSGVPLVQFSLHGRDGGIYAVNLLSGEFFMNGTVFMLDQPLEELKDRKLIYYRTNRMNMQTHERYTHAFNFGYEGKHPESGKIVKKVITIQ